MIKAAATGPALASQITISVRYYKALRDGGGVAGGELYLFTNANWIVPGGVENVILRLSVISLHLATAVQ